MCAIQRQLSCRLTAHIVSSVAREEIQRKTRFPERKIDLTDTNNEILNGVKRRSDVSVSGEATKVIFINNQLDTQFFFMYVYFYSLRVSGSHVPIIRRNNCINTASGICHSV